MTSTDVLRILLRRWYVVVAGLALTAAAVLATTATQGVYSAQTDVIFLGPKSVIAPNPIEASSESLIATAGLVARMTSNLEAAPATASSGVSLTGQGIRQGYSIELPNRGGQWASNFDRPVLVVQVAGPSEAWVRATLATQIHRIDDALRTLQERDGVGKQNYIITSSAPNLATVDYANGDPKRVMVAKLLLGTALTGLAAIGVDRSLVGFRRRGIRVRPTSTRLA
jgi:hypothetical protein